VTPELFAEKVRNADIKVVGITNHNLFDYSQYKQLAAAVGSDCQIWPGVELNVKGSNGKQWHLIVVSDPTTVTDFDRILRELTTGTTPETCLLDIEDIVKAFETLDCFYIPHYHKSPQISEEDSEKLLELVGDSFKILNETSDIRSMGVFANHNYRVVIGSDVRDWAEYEKSTFSELRLPIESFHQLYMLAKRDSQVVQTLLSRNDPREVEFTFVGKASLKLSLYHEINVIFGSKGTGKSEILSAIKETLEREGYSCSYYVGDDKDNQFKQLLTTDGMMRHVGIVGAVAAESHFQVIRDWEDESPTPILDYVQWVKTKDSSANKLRMKITQASTPNEPDEAHYQEAKQDSENIGKALKILNRIDFNRYLDEAEVNQLDDLIEQLDQAISKEFRASLIDKHATVLSKQGIELIKRLADKMTNTKSRPSTTGFSAFAANRLKLQNSVHFILENICDKQQQTREIIGSLEGKGNVYIQSTYRMYCPESKAGEFGDKKITDIAKAFKQLKVVEKKCFDDGVYHDVSSLVDAFENAGINSSEQFLGLSKKVVLGDGLEYKPSNGEKAILMMQRILSVERDVYIFDEPELGMGNSYIDENIRPKLSGLGKSKKMVIIATHNANIAVRTLPYTSIYREHDNGTYKTYVGNPFVNSLQNLEDAADVKNWKDTSMTVLEGGVEAFYERKDIYESRSN
jgi:predicted ATPase